MQPRTPLLNLKEVEKLRFARASRRFRMRIELVSQPLHLSELVVTEVERFQSVMQRERAGDTACEHEPEQVLCHGEPGLDNETLGQGKYTPSCLDRQPDISQPLLLPLPLCRRHGCRRFAAFATATAQLPLLTATDGQQMSLTCQLVEAKVHEPKALGGAQVVWDAAAQLVPCKVDCLQLPSQAEGGGYRARQRVPTQGQVLWMKGETDVRAHLRVVSRRLSMAMAWYRQPAEQHLQTALCKAYGHLQRRRGINVVWNGADDAIERCTEETRDGQQGRWHVGKALHLNHEEGLSHH